MSRITLITGGSRSGKSSFAQRLAEGRPGSRLFLATCPVIDREMEVRVLRHIRDRQKGNWETVEEPLRIAVQLRQAGRYDTVLVDCLTLWVNNLMYAAREAGKVLDEDGMEEHTAEVLSAAERHPGEVIMVTNEVGMGIVPENREARIYRDLVGRCNQSVAATAQKVYLVSCGIPLLIKGKDTNAL